MRIQMNKTANTKNSFLSLIEIAIVILSGFVASFAMKAVGISFFALPHLVFLLLLVFFRSIVSKWKLSDYGFSGSVGQQIKLGILVWIVAQTYYSVLHLFAPLFPEAAKIGATVFKIATPDALRDAILSIAIFKAGILETLRYFSYAEGLLIQAFGAPLGALMTFAYFGSAHMGIMNLIVLPVSFLFVYYYRTYRLVIPLIISHALGDTGGFMQNYFSFHGMYAYNYVIFFLLLAGLFLFRNELREVLSHIRSMVVQDIIWLRDNKVKAISLSLVLPLWLQLLLYVENHI